VKSALDVIGRSADPRKGPESDFTSAIKPIEKAAGVVGGKAGHAAK